MERSRSVSMQDIAAEAGVSAQTVSRVANGGKAVKPETRQRVEEAMAKLGYRPNTAARALKHGRFQNIGVVLFDMTSYGDSRILNAIAEAAQSQEYAVTVQRIVKGNGHTLQSAVERMRQLPVDGVIVVLQEYIDDFNTYEPDKELPVVIIAEEPAAHCPTIDADNYGCAKTAVEYLLEHGHRTVYHIAGPVVSRAARIRQLGWQDALRKAGIAIPPLYRGDWNADSGYQAGLALANEPDCTAVYAANDQMAYGAILGLQAAGKRVPEDVSVMGVDDSLIGMVPRLGLTTMRMPFTEIGRQAFDMIIRQCEGGLVPANTRRTVATTLIERASVR